MSPVGPYYPDGFKPVALYGTTEYVRAAPGGMHAFPAFLFSSFLMIALLLCRHWCIQAWSQLRARHPSPTTCRQERIRAEPLASWPRALHHRGRHYERVRCVPQGRWW